MDQIDAGSWGEIIVGIFGVLIGAVLSVYFYLKSKKRPSLSFQIEVKRVLRIDGVNADELEIRFKGKEIKSLCLASLRIRNTGAVPIRPEDWHRGLTFSFPEGVDIFEATVTYSEPENLVVSILPAQNKSTGIEVMPLLLNEDDGFVIEALISEARVPKVDARVVGVKKISDLDEEIRLRPVPRWYLPTVASIAGIATTAFSHELLARLGYIDPVVNDQITKWVMNIAMGLFVLLQFGLMRRMYKRKEITLIG